MSEDTPIPPLTIIRLLERIRLRYSAGALLIVRQDLGAALLASHSTSAPAVRVHKAQCEIFTPTPKRKKAPRWST